MSSFFSFSLCAKFFESGRSHTQRWPQLSAGGVKKGERETYKIKGYRFLNRFPTRMIIKFHSRCFDVYVYTAVLDNSLSSISNYKRLTRTVYDFSID